LVVSLLALLGGASLKGPRKFLRVNAHLAVFGAVTAATCYPLALAIEVPVGPRSTGAHVQLDAWEWSPQVARVAATGCVLTGYALYAMATTSRAQARLTPYHARHCPNCGYDLLGVTKAACPECDHAIAADQAELLRQLRSTGRLPSNGSHPSSSPPTAST
ncbi:MAG: hypothetical protein AAFR96_09165, partial [Planctomycetota bacterium]